MKNIKLALIYILTLNSSLSFSQKKLTFSDAINMADKQRMLIQKMAKDKMFIEVNKKRDKSEKELKNSILEFELAVEVLKDFAPNDLVKYKIDIQELTFKTYKMFLLKTKKESLDEVIHMNTLFLEICNDVFNSFLEYSEIKSKNKSNEHRDKNIIKLSNSSGNIRYLTQRLTLYHAINYYKIKTIYPDEINNIINKLEKSLNYLTISEFNTLEIDDSLSKVFYYWNHLKSEMIKSGKEKSGISKINPEKLFELTSTILQKTNPITKMYADLKE